jgi:hypothetical protein
VIILENDAGTTTTTTAAVEGGVTTAPARDIAGHGDRQSGIDPRSITTTAAATTAAGAKDGITTIAAIAAIDWCCDVTTEHGTETTTTATAAIAVAIATIAAIRRPRRSSVPARAATHSKSSGARFSGVAAIATSATAAEVKGTAAAGRAILAIVRCPDRRRGKTSKQHHRR